MKLLPRAILASLLGTLAVFLFHYAMPSMLNEYRTDISLAASRIDEAHLEEIVRYHVNHPVFAGRPLTSFFIRGTHRVLGTGYGTSFALVNFGLLFLSGIVLYMLAYSYRGKVRDAAMSVVIFFTSFTILFAFFASIYTYDEPLQYLFLFTALLALRKQQMALAMVALVIACVARETTLFLFPALYFFYLPKDGKWGGRWRRLILMALPVIAFGVIEIGILYTNGMIGANETYLTESRFTHAALNFQTWQYGFESVWSIALALGFPLAVVAAYHLLVPSSREDSSYARAFWLTVLINTPIVLISALAREARLFALPLIFLWPVLGMCAEEVYAGLRNVRLSRPIPFLICVIAAATLFIFLAKEIFHRYTPTASGYFDVGYRVYSVFIIALWIKVLFLAAARLRGRRVGVEGGGRA